MTKEQVTKRGQAVLKQMHGPGWTLRVHENLGWHWSLVNGKMSLHGSYLGHANPERYHVLIADHDEYQGCGSMNWSTNQYFEDPNDAVYHAIEKVKDFTEKTLDIFTELCDYLDQVEKDNWAKQLLEPLKKKEKKDFIGGKKITRKEALKGLGNPSTWAADKKRLEKEMKKKPVKK